MGLGTPRKGVINPMCQCGKNDSQQAHGHNKR